MQEQRFVVPLAEVRRGDVGRVGGKNASLGEMIANLRERGIRVPPGFATTADAYWALVDDNDLRDAIGDAVAAMNDGGLTLEEAGGRIRALFLSATIPESVAAAIDRAYADLCAKAGEKDVAVAVRSSATAEDLPEASFAGQLETFLNIRGREALHDACRRCFASLFTDRAISYREQHEFDQLEVALSIGVQRMVRSDRAGAGVMFTLDTETGFPDVVRIDASWGLGEAVVSGEVDPDQYLVFAPALDDPELRPILQRELGAKERRIVYAGRDAEEPTRDEKTPARLRRRFVLDDDEILQLARWGLAIQEHYGRPMDIEWAKDGDSGELFVVQARPETVHAGRRERTLKSYRLGSHGEVLSTGVAVGASIATGIVRHLSSPDESERFEDGDILVTEQTDPDWGPIMRRAAAIVTDHGGRTSHAAIVSRELGLPAVVGAGDATEVLEDGAEVTVSCTGGERGVVYAGAAEFEVEELALEEVPDTETRIMLNLADPAAAMQWWQLPVDGVGLARMEFIINNHIRIHPMALARYQDQEPAVKRRIDELTRGYDDKAEFFVDRLAGGIARIAAVMHPRPVIVRLSDFKSNEYAQLIGGSAFEPEEDNPMIGWRGASRYYAEGYRDGFALECRALRRAREEMGLDNVVVMIPFCRTLTEADRVLDAMAEHGLERGDGGLEVYLMCEIPANVILAERFAERVDGFSIGSNDLTQLVLGVDRDSDILAELFDERDPAVMAAIEAAITGAHRAGVPIGLCGQKPSDDPEFARFLVGQRIDSISITPDTFLQVKRIVADAEAERRDASRAA